MRGALYLRISTQEQVGGTSLESQKEACLSKAKELGIEVLESHIFSEVYSGASLDRPQLTELAKLVRDKRIEAVVCWSVDRLSRKLVQQMVIMHEFEKSGVSFSFVKTPYGETPEEKMLFNMLGAYAEFEREVIRLRTMGGRRSRIVNEGKIMGGGKLFGYHYADNKRTINEGEARVVKDIFRWLTEERQPINAIITRLNSKGIESPSGKQWGKSTIYGMLINPAYAGHTFAYTRSKVKPQKQYKDTRTTELTSVKLKPKEEWVELSNATPTIISDEVFNSAQDILKRNKEMASRNRKHSYLLAGYVFCKQCVRRYAGNFSHNQRYYSCRSCANKSWRADYLENLVWEKLVEIFTAPENLAATMAKVDRLSPNSEAKRELGQCQTRLGELDKEQEELLKQSLRGFPEDMVKNENIRINKARIDTQKRVEELGGIVNTADSATLKLRTITRNVAEYKKFLNQVKEFTPEGARNILERFKVKVWLDNETTHLEGVFPSELFEQERLLSSAPLYG